MANVKLTAEPRDKTGSGASKRLRRDGKIPAVLYGHGEATVHLAVPLAAAQELVFGHAQMVDLDIAGGRTESALVRGTQYDLHAEFVTHIDFLRVSADEPVEVEVEVKLTGTPKGEKEGGSVDHQAHAVTVKCLPANIPAVLELAIDELDLNDSLHAGDLSLPPGVELITPPETSVVSIQPPTVEEEAAPAEGEEGEAATEPELIKPEREEAGGDAGGE